MKFIPIENIEYLTHYSPEQVLSKLSKDVGPKMYTKFKISDKDNLKSYEGNLEIDGFSISRVTGYRNSFLPQIKGKVLPYNKGAKVKVRMRLHLIVQLLLSLIMLFIMSFIGVALYYSESEDIPIDILAPLGMLAFVYLLTMVLFKYESKKSKAYFYKLLNS